MAASWLNFCRQMGGLRPPTVDTERVHPAPTGGGAPPAPARYIKAVLPAGAAAVPSPQPPATTDL